jgi:hypothetical protein
LRERLALRRASPHDVIDGIPVNSRWRYDIRR